MVNNSTISESQEKAIVINQKLSSVFTNGNVSTLPDLGFSPYDSLVTEDINVEGVAKLFSDLQSHKAHGPDSIPAYLLKETAISMAPLLTLIFKASLHQHQLPSNWKTALVFLILKRIMQVYC